MANYIHSMPVSSKPSTRRQRSRCYKRRLSLWMLALVIACNQAILSAAASSSASDARGDDDSLEDETEDKTAETVIAVFSFFCSMCISLFSFLLAYYAIIEDNLIQRYDKQGTALKANVISFSFARAASKPAQQSEIKLEQCTCSPPPEENCEQEYVADIEYKFPGLQEFSDTRIQKKIKVLGSDLMLKKMDSVPQAIKIQVDLEDDRDEFSLSNEKSSSDHSGCYEIQVLVLQTHKRSGIGLEHVKRMSDITYRVPTILMVLLTQILAVFCAYISVNTISEEEDHMSRLAQLALVHLFVLFVEALTVQACFAYTLYKMVEDEYLQGGGILIERGDTSTISSGDGSYMLL